MKQNNKGYGKCKIPYSVCLQVGEKPFMFYFKRDITAFFPAICPHNSHLEKIARYKL